MHAANSAFVKHFSIVHAFLNLLTKELISLSQFSLDCLLFLTADNMCSVSAKVIKLVKFVISEGSGSSVLQARRKQLQIGGGGGTHKKQLQIGGAHIIFFKMTDHFFWGGGAYLCKLLGGGPPCPPIPTGLCFKFLSSPHASNLLGCCLSLKQDFRKVYFLKISPLLYWTANCDHQEYLQCLRLLNDEIKTSSRQKYVFQHHL